MLPNFTIVICGAVVTVIMLAVTGSGLITPETRTRIGAMPEVGRPMMQHLIAEPAGQARIAILEVERRAEEIGRLGDLPPSVPGPVPAVTDDERPGEPAPAQSPGEPAALSIATPAAPAIAAPAAPTVVAPAPVETPPAMPGVAAAAPATLPFPPAEDADDGAVADAPPAPPREAPADGVTEAAVPESGATELQSVAALADKEEVVGPPIHGGAPSNVRLPRAHAGTKVTPARKPVRHAIRRPHRHRGHRFYAASNSYAYPFGPSGVRFR
jgi:hypothetical protein